MRGFALPSVVVAAYTGAQRLTPASLQGRVAAAVGFVLFAPQPVAQVLGAALIDHVDYRLVYGGAAATGACALLLRTARERRDPRQDRCGCR